jgi:Protein of unknown function
MLRPNKSFKPNLPRYAGQVGLIPVLGLIKAITMTDSIDDPELDADDLLAVASLSQDDIRAIDYALTANSHSQWRKVAYVVSMAMDAYPDRFHDISDIFYAARVKALVSQGVLEAQGNLSRMRFSEIRLPSQGPSQ